MATVHKVKVLPLALASDYSAAYRTVHGRECHYLDYHRVADAVRDGCPDGTAYLVETDGKRYLSNPSTGWMHQDPAGGTFRILEAV